MEFSTAQSSPFDANELGNRARMEGKVCCFSKLCVREREKIVPKSAIRFLILPLEKLPTSSHCFGSVPLR